MSIIMQSGRANVAVSVPAESDPAGRIGCQEKGEKMRVVSNFIVLLNCFCFSYGNDTIDLTPKRNL